MSQLECPYCQEGVAPGVEELGRTAPATWSCGCGNELDISSPIDLKVGELQDGTETYLQIRPFPTVRGNASLTAIEDKATASEQDEAAERAVRAVTRQVVIVRDGRILEERPWFEASATIPWPEIARSLFGDLGDSE